ncbi:hypothetical protein PBY51_018496 [Eleginops maclovinus]|uniref:Vacuolar protein sorting 13 homolog C n=1 Tax=Eleginops maclovinus TaxID=56733 RepID=A0AAN7Y7R8_ELEMC|nr:hypothetical protein PBY51_018496 [Eleginops maclovinus]
MVFESLVSDLLNRFIGDYVENLDKSQLKIGIWGGNVVLENLRVKENALSEFDVPFKVKAGQIGRLTLKIPWKNLYSDAVVATLDGLYLLVVPGATIKYDAKKEESDQQEAKQKELQRIEEALQLAASREKPLDQKKDSFAEKLATQVIKNLQVKITSIHLRFEDDLSDPQRPLSVGVTLSELSLQTTDENWKSCILNEAAKISYKLGRLECLCAYWNVNSPIFYKGSWEDIVDQLKVGISSKDLEIPHYQYIFKPIFASAKMCINPTAELELKSPKLDLNLEVQNIDIQITKPQYLSLVEVLESVDCMVKNAPYRRFRPEEPVHNNAKLWWRYGFNSVLQVHIRRLSTMWSWSNIRRHRDNLKTYKTAYKNKLLNQNKSSPNAEKTLQDLEKVLDVFNITLTRQQAHMEVIRSGQAVGMKASGGQKQGRGGFFSSFFGRKTKKEEPEEREEGSGLDELMTAEEKQKLYTAIGYSGSSHNLNLPSQYVAVVLSFHLCKASVTVRDQPDIPEILKVQMLDLSTRISQRPGAQAFRVEAGLQHWFVTGLQQGGAVPSLMSSVSDSSSSLLTLEFEVNPDTSNADQLLRVRSQSVQILYDALTVNSMVDFFKMGRGVDLERLTSATLSKLEEIKEKTATGLSHIIETRKVLDLRVDLQPSFLLLPQSGFYCETSDLIIVDFGSLQLNSVEQSAPPSSSLEEIMDRAYEKYNLELRRVQVLFSKAGEGWRAARLQPASQLHLLQPLDVSLQLAKCMVDRDARMPRFKVSGELPLLHLKISDLIIHGLLDLVDSIPLPNMGSPPSTPTEKGPSYGKPLVLNLPLSLLDPMEADSDDSSGKSTEEGLQRSAQEEITDLHFKFEVKEVLLEMLRQQSTVLSLSVCELGAEGRSRSFDLSITAYLRRVALDYCDLPDDRKPLHLMRSSETQNSDLLKVDFIKADPAGPSFKSLFHSTEQTLKVEVSSLDFLLHTKALLSTFSFLNSALPQRPRTPPPEDRRPMGETRTASAGSQEGGVFSFKMFAMLGSFHVEMFVDHFQTAKAALSAATAQAAAQAALSVKDFAQKSFRLSLDIKLKAPLIIVPQNSSSQHALVMDLGLITVGNSFSLLPAEGCPLPALMEKMEIRLTQLKLSRTTLQPGSSQMAILQPINVELLVKRNMAASWFTKIPGVQVQGILRSLKMNLGEEDLRVLMKILVENIGEGSKTHIVDTKTLVAQERAEPPEQQVELLSNQTGSDSSSHATNGALTENTINVLLNFEIKEVLLSLKKQEVAFLVFQAAQLGINTQVRKFDTVATTFINQISLTCPEFNDSSGAALCLISSSVSGHELLKVQYVKADRSGPNFSSVYKNTEQMINVVFSSLDLMLHTEALLSAIDFLSVALSSGRKSSPERDIRMKIAEKTPSAKSTALVTPEGSDIIDLKVMMTLGAFNVLVCDQSCNIAHIKIQGLNGSLLMQGPQTHISACLKDFIVLNVDPNSIHKKAISIVGDEVFSLSLSLTPNATEGPGYADTSKTDGRVKLSLGCIQVVYLHKFIISLLNFSNNFQTAKVALTAATAQAAAQAALSVKDFAQKSFRLSMDIKLKAPLIIVPQNSSSKHALVMDLGLITVVNSFSLLPADGCPLPALMEKMEVQLTQLKLSRTCLDLNLDPTAVGGPGIELLEPVNLKLMVRRNLSSSWYKKMVAVEVDGDLKPMKVELSQEDLKVLLKILTENLGEASGPETSNPRPEALRQLGAATSPLKAEPVAEISKEDQEDLENLRLNFNIESLGLVLYSNDPKQPLALQHQQDLQLGELALHRLQVSGMIRSSGSLEVTAVLSGCNLDDLRTGVERASSRMVGRRDEDSAEAMIDLTYRQSAGDREVVFVLQRLYLCASIEFLVAVADFFLQAIPQKQNTATIDRLPLRQTAKPRTDTKTASPVRTRLRMVVLDPEVVFVASLMKADAPALVVSFQCDFSLQLEDGQQDMRANLRELGVLACPFIRNQEDAAITTVLRPCSVALETKTLPNQPMSGCVTVEEVVLKISPFILNTVMTITAAMTPRPRADDTAALEVGDLWLVRNIYGCDFWFLGVDSATEATESFREPDRSCQGENFRAEVKVVQVTLESGFGHRTVPLLLAESSFSGSAKNWSSLLQLRADMTLEVNYFNEVHAVWEPLIERVDAGRRRWTLELEMKNNPLQDRSPVHGDDFVILPEPRLAVSISSKDTLNVTVSQSSLSVLQNLAKAFSEGASSTFDPSLKEKAPFTIRNSLGIPLMVQHSPTLRPRGPPGQGKLHELPVDQSLDLELSMIRTSSRGKLSALQQQESSLFSLTIVPSGYSEISNIAVDKPGRRLYNIRGPMLQEAVSVLLQIDASDGNKVITVRSPLQIRNHFSVPFTVLKFCPASRSLMSVGQAEPETDFHIDLETYRCQLFVAPAGPLAAQYGASSSCVAWKEQVHRSLEVCSVLQCPALDGSLPLMVSALALPDNLQHINSHGEEDWDPAYILHLHPGATLRNLLPFRVGYMMESSADSYELPEGCSADLLNARVSGEILSVVLMRYQGRDWHGHIRIHHEVPEFFSVVLTCDSESSMTVDVSVHVTRTSSRLLLALFSPYWIINKTSRVLQYRAEDLTVKHPAEHRDIVLFSFRKKNLFSKSKIQLCVSTSSWSEAFSPDTVGSYGCVRCPANNMDYLVGVSIQMSSTNLTRIVTMSPFFTLLNKSSYELEVGEVCSQMSTRWHYIASTECVPLWPENPSGKLCIRVVGSESSSKFFFFNRQDSGTLLRLDQCGGIILDINMSDHSTIISFNEYYEGAAPALLLNHTPWASIRYKQSGSAVVQDLNPGEGRLFVWDDPTGVRTLSWSCMENHGDLDLLKDDVGQFSYDNRAQVHWVSFLDGRQRVLLFTEDVAVVTKARQAEELEQFEQEVKVSLQNLGLSLINNKGRQEVAYIGITSSGVVWEMKPKSRWKPFSQKNINLLEEAFQRQLGGGGGWVTLETNLEVNLGATIMMMRQPISCPVRRNFLSGIQVEFKQSPHQRCLRAQLHWLQVDNHLPGAIFPIVFHPVPPPKSIALDSEPKPFIDVSVITRFNQHSSVMQIKYFMALVQEMAVRIDQVFLSAILALFTPAADLQAERQKARLLDRDLQMLQTELMETSLSDTSTLSFFEHFHISPIKLHLSLSLGSSGEESAPEAMQSLNLLLKSIGATLTDVDDLIFKLAFFEVKYQFYRREKLMWAVVRHYSEQFLKQMYVLVLGLDVLGNPFGLIRGLSEGVEAFFYEPFQGAVQGPEEFAEGFVIGVRSLLGHTVGGAAGMVSRITGSVGKDFGESLAKGGKGLLKGVMGGVTGIVTKPVEGAKKEGAAGFFKGIGKGLVGVVARPTGGIVDMASSTFHGIQRAAESTEEVSKLRLRPLPALSDKTAGWEVFRDHCPYPGHKKTSIIITNRRVLCVKQIDFLGHFNREWECLFENFYRPPSLEGTRLNIYCKDHRGGLQRDSQPVRRLELRDSDSAQKLQTVISEAQVRQQQQSMKRQKSQRFLRVKQ